MKKEKIYTAKEIEILLWLPCCHVSGMHDPVHFENRAGVCEIQKRHAFERLCKELNINPQTKSDPKCGWCIDYPDKKKGENLKMFKS